MKLVPLAKHGSGGIRADQGSGPGGPPYDFEHMPIARALKLAGMAAAIATVVVPQAAPQALVPWRAWQFHKLNMPYVLASMKLARNYDVNTVVFSHDMLGYASQLLDGSGRGAQLTALAKAAHEDKLKAWI